MQSTAGEVRTNSKAAFSDGLLHTDIPVLVNLQNLAFASSGCRLEDLSRTVTDRDRLQKRVKGIYAVSTP